MRVLSRILFFNTYSSKFTGEYLPFSLNTDRNIDPILSHLFPPNAIPIDISLLVMLWYNLQDNLVAALVRNRSAGVGRDVVYHVAITKLQDAERPEGIMPICCKRRVCTMLRCKKTIISWDLRDGAEDGRMLVETHPRVWQ